MLRIASGVHAQFLDEKEVAFYLPWQKLLGIWEWFTMATD
jgi:hypothetical protein